MENQKHKCKFIRLVNGPALVIDWCPRCKQEIVDVINRGPNRLEVTPSGKLIDHSHIMKGK